MGSALEDGEEVAFALFHTAFDLGTVRALDDFGISIERGYQVAYLERERFLYEELCIEPHGLCKSTVNC